MRIAILTVLLAAFVTPFIVGCETQHTETTKTNPFTGTQTKTDSSSTTTH